MANDSHHTRTGDSSSRRQRTSGIDPTAPVSAHTVESATCAQHRALLTAVHRCESYSARFLGEDPTRVGIRELLTTLAGEMRAAAVVFVLDPTLAQEPNSPRWRSMDLLIELSRQLPHLLQQASDTRSAASRSLIPERWAEALALHERALEIARSIPELVPRPEPTTPHGQRAISTERLAPHGTVIADAAALVRDAVELALATAHPDPTAVELDHIARRLEHIAIEIDGHEIPDVLPRSGPRHT